MQRWQNRRKVLRAAVRSTDAQSLIEGLEGRQLLSAVTPAQARHAYGFDQVAFTNSAGQSVTADGSGQTIAIVNANDDPNIANDVHAFDQQFGLADPVFQKVSQTGSTTALPTADSGWSQETSLDVEWAHAIAPGAKILLVEANSSSLNDLLSAVDYARNQAGVSVVSMSWGASEFSSETSYDSHFTTPAGHTPVTFVAASGDNGAPCEWPAVSPNVVGVGGTALTLNADDTWASETAWSGSGGGISRYESKPSYQSSVTQSSTRRTGPDVAYDADPNTGFLVYDSFGGGGWYQVGGTSAGSPQWSALLAVANQGRQVNGNAALDGRTGTLPALYQMSLSDFHDVTSGSNGYSATTGYDLATGRGSPIANKVIADLVGSGTTTTTSPTPTPTTTSPGGKKKVNGKFADVGGKTLLDFNSVAVLTGTPASVAASSPVRGPTSLRNGADGTDVDSAGADDVVDAAVHAPNQRSTHAAAHAKHGTGQTRQRPARSLGVAFA